MAKGFKLEVMTPSKRFYKGQVDLVIVTTTEGDEGYMADHIRSCKLLEISELWIHEKDAGRDDWKVAAISGGFVEMHENMFIYTDAVELSDEIDIDRVEEERAKAEKWIEEHPEEDPKGEFMKAARAAIKKAQIRKNVYEGGKRH